MVTREPLVGISRVHLACRLRRVFPRLHCGRDVPGAGAAAQDAPFAFDLLSSSAVDRAFRRDHTIALVGIRTLHARFGEWLFCGRTVAVDPDHVRDRSLASLWINITGSIPALVCAKTSGGTLHHWFLRV